MTFQGPADEGMAQGGQVNSQGHLARKATWGLERRLGSQERWPLSQRTPMGNPQPLQFQESQCSFWPPHAPTGTSHTHIGIKVFKEREAVWIQSKRSGTPEGPVSRIHWNFLASSLPPFLPRLLEADSKSMRSMNGSRRNSGSSLVSSSSASSNLSHLEEDTWILWGRIANEWEEWRRRKEKLLKVA